MDSTLTLALVVGAITLAVHAAYVYYKTRSRSAVHVSVVPAVAAAVACFIAHKFQPQQFVTSFLTPAFPPASQGFF